MEEQNCIFCQIASGKVPSKKVYEDDFAVAILDINPANSGHVLIIPKRHYPLMMQAPSDVIGHLFMIAKNISNKLLKALKVDGTNIIVANGAIAGQKAPHLMIHVIPRNENDGLNMTLPENDIRTDPQLMDAVVKSIASRLSIPPEIVAQYYTPAIPSQPPQDVGEQTEDLQGAETSPAGTKQPPFQQSPSQPTSQPAPQPAPQPTPQPIRKDDEEEDLDKVSNLFK